MQLLKSMEKSKYYLSAISAFVIWGMFSLALRPLKGVAPLDILFYRILFCIPLLLVVVFLFRREALRENLSLFHSLSKPKRQNFLLRNFIAGSLLAGNWFSFIYVMNFVSVKATSLAYLVCPILTAILAFFFLAEPMKRIQWVAIFLAAAACIALSFGHFTDLILSTVIALSYAIYLVLQRKNQGFDLFLLLVFQIIVAAVFLIPFYPMYAAEVPQTFDFYGLIATIAVLFTIIPLFLNMYSLKGISSGTVGMLININPIIAFALSVLYFKEPTDAFQIAAYGVIFVSVLIFNLPALTAKKQ